MKLGFFYLQSFFHTILRNGPYCEKVIKTNLRLLNFKKPSGCDCHNRYIVDWCGCSPLDFKPSQVPRIKVYWCEYMSDHVLYKKNQATKTNTKQDLKSAKTILPS